MEVATQFRQSREILNQIYVSTGGGAVSGTQRTQPLSGTVVAKPPPKEELDVGDPTRPKLLAHRNLDPPFGGGAHSPLPLPDRNLLVLADEANFANCSRCLRHTWLFDVREPTNPVSFATMPVPSEADYCAKGGNFGPHNLWENRPGAFQSSRFVFATYHNAGVRVFDIENPLQPREAGFFVPPDPERMFDPRPNRPKVIQSADCFVDAQGVIYLTDNNAGLYVLQFEGA